MNASPDNADLHELEFEIRTELTLAETDEPELDAGVVAIEPTFGPERQGYQEVKYEETERYEAGLRSLLGAIESVEIGSVEIESGGIGSGGIGSVEIESGGIDSPDDQVGRA